MDIKIRSDPAQGWNFSDLQLKDDLGPTKDPDQQEALLPVVSVNRMEAPDSQHHRDLFEPEEALQEIEEVPKSSQKIIKTFILLEKS